MRESELAAGRGQQGVRRGGGAGVGSSKGPGRWEGLERNEI